MSATTSPTTLLAIDVGAGTQDILLYDAARPAENAVKLVLPSQTQVVARRVRAATEARLPIHLTGHLMGGGASSDAIKAHLAAGLAVSAEPGPAQTVHNDLARVEAMGVAIRPDAPSGATSITLGDLDLPALAAALAPFGIDLPETVAVAVQDHGYRPGIGNNTVRFDYLQSLLANGGDLAQTVYQTPPDGMTRMRAVAEANPGAWLMDTGAAAVIGILGDPRVADAVNGPGAILVNVGNMHTFATLVRGRRLFGLFEHHTGGITAAIIHDLVERLRRGQLDAESFHRDFDGHGAAIDSAYAEVGPFDFVTITGPNRGIARTLGYHEAAPHGDMMLAGSFGLVAGVLLRTLPGDAPLPTLHNHETLLPHHH